MVLRLLDDVVAGLFLPGQAPAPTSPRGPDHSLPLLHLEQVSEETLLTLLQHSLVCMNLAVGDVRVRLVVRGLLKESSGLAKKKKKLINTKFNVLPN